MPLNVDLPNKPAEGLNICSNLWLWLQTSVHFISLDWFWWASSDHTSKLISCKVHCVLDPCACQQPCHTGHDMPAGLASLTQFLCCASYNSAMEMPRVLSCPCHLHDLSAACAGPACVQHACISDIERIFFFSKKGQGKFQKNCHLL